MRIQSNDIVLLDTTDTKKIDLHITSNHPTVQIYDKNNTQEPLTPDWKKNPLVLTPVLYIDSEPIVDDSDLTFKWTRIRGSETNEESVGNTKILTISTNQDLDTYPTVRYKCKVEYNNGKSFFNEITFARIENGVVAPTVQARYSIDGNKANMEAALDPTIHKYIHFSYDGGLNWTEGVKIAGEQGKDGQSVSLKGTAYTNDELIVNGVVVLYSDEAKQTQIVGKASGDSYLVEGYLCVYNGSQFICTGQLQGPKGEDGSTYYLYIRYSNDINGSDFSDTPGNRKYVGFYRSTVTPLPANIDRTSATWNWAKFVGEDAKGVTLTSSAQVFKIDKSNIMTPATITVTAQAINTTIPSDGWTYSIDGGKTFSDIAPTGISRNGNIVTIDGANITQNSIVIKVSASTYSDFLTIYKVFDGSDGTDGTDGKSAPIAFLTNENISFAANSSGQVAKTTVTCNVVAYSGTTQVAPAIGTILSSEIPSGMTINKSTVANQIRLTLDIPEPTNLGSDQNTNGVINIPVTSPVSTTLQLTWSKINSGVGIKSTTVAYGVSDSASTRPTDTAWQSTIPVVAEGKYLWTRTIIDYTDDAISDTVTYTYTKQGSTGATGPTGSSGTSVTVKSIKYQAGTSATVAPTGTWSDSVVAVAEGNYLWTQTTFSDNKVAYGVAKQGQKGDQGVQGPKGNDGQQYYTWVKYADTPTSGMSNDPDGKTYIGLAYNKTTATESTTYSDYAWSLIRGATGAVGPKGADGQQYYTWIKYADNASGANMSDLPDGKSYIGLAYNKTTSTESNTASDYTWALFKGDKGANGTNASLVDITPSALYFKSTTGKDGTFTPDYIYLYPRFQTVTFSKWEYSVNGGITWVAASGANGITISTYNSIANTLRIAKTSTLYTDTVTSISFRCVSSNASVYDTVSIAKLFDVDVEEINTRITDSLAEVKTTTDSISSRVSSTEASIASINNNVSSITTRISAAEQKITPNAIVSTVRQSTDYTNDLGKKVNSNEIISKINQTAENITISANKIGLLGATNIPDLTADKIKGGTLTLGGSSAQTQNGQILVKNSSDTDMIAINQYGMAITDGNLTIVNESELNDYGGWSAHSHTELKTTGIESVYVGANSSAQFRAELDAITGLTLDSFGGVNANPYYFRIGPTMDDLSDLGTEMTFYENLVMKDGTNDNIIADISLDEVVLPKANIILQDTTQKNIQFQNASKELRSCMLYAGANDSTTVMGAWDTTKSKSIFTYSTDNKFYILDSEAVTKSMMQSSVGERGYQKLPSGLIIQWGYQGSALTVSGNYNLTTGNITLPIAFPNSFTGVFCNIIEADNGTLSGYYNITAKANGLTGFTWKTYNYWNNWGSSILFSWIAIGY